MNNKLSHAMVGGSMETWPSV